MAPTGSIEGVVKDTNNSPLEDSKVVVTAGPEQLDIAALTGTDGTFGFGDLQPGDYKIQAFSCFTASAHIPVQVKSGKVAFVEIVLEAASAEDDFVDEL